MLPRAGNSLMSPLHRVCALASSSTESISAAFPAQLELEISRLPQASRCRTLFICCGPFLLVGGCRKGAIFETTQLPSVGGKAGFFSRNTHNLGGDVIKEGFRERTLCATGSEMSF